MPSAGLLLLNVVLAAPPGVPAPLPFTLPPPGPMPTPARVAVRPPKVLPGEATVPPPAFERGDEWVYRGTVTEVVDRAGVRFRRAHDLEVRVLVVGRQKAHADLAVLTLLRRTDDVVTASASAVAGAQGRPPAPPAARLDLVRVDAAGTARLLVPAPAGDAVTLGDSTPGPLYALPAVPLDGFAPSEVGLLPPRPAGPLSAAAAWAAPDPDTARPPQSWAARADTPDDYVAGGRCLPATLTQRSPTWLAPRGGEAAWERAETVWLSTEDGTARRVRRSITQRVGLNPNPTVTVEVKYELDGQTRLNGRAFERARREVEVAVGAAARLDRLAPDATRLGPRPFEVQLAKLDEYLKANQPGTAYREAVLSVARRLDAARSGDGVKPAPAGRPFPADRVDGAPTPER